MDLPPTSPFKFNNSLLYLLWKITGCPLLPRKEGTTIPPFPWSKALMRALIVLFLRKGWSPRAMRIPWQLGWIAWRPLRTDVLMPILERGLMTIFTFRPWNRFFTSLFRMPRTTTSSCTSDRKRVSKQCSKMVFLPQGSDNLSTPILFDSPAPRRTAEIFDIFPFRWNFRRQMSRTTHPLG